MAPSGARGRTRRSNRCNYMSPGICAVLLFAIIFCWLSMAMGVDAQLMICPQVCSCIWRNGKQTTICENQNLISIPNQIQPSTQVLDLNTNNFQILPSKAFQERGLINLQKLFLPRCKLGAIAEDAFVQLTNLVELDLSENLLTHVPVRALANTTNLRRLLLNNNHIATINAESFAALANLKFLNLSGCQTHTIEARAFWGLHDLEYLYLHSNHLSTLPYTVVQDLPALYSFDLYRNPWHCNCEMRATREWMIRNNVGQSIPPACELPARLTGLMWNSLDLDDFACEPDIITTNVDVAKSVGSNATLSCLVKGLPEPRIYWYLDDGFYRNLSSAAVRGDKYHLVEERSEGTVHSMLTIINLDGVDDTGSFICWAENRAGMKSKNFTLSVLPSSAFGTVTANWSKVELAGAIVGILMTLVVAFVLITLVLIRSKRFSSVLSNAKKFNSNSGDAANSGPTKVGSMHPHYVHHNNHAMHHTNGSIDKKSSSLVGLLKGTSSQHHQSTTNLVYPQSHQHHNFGYLPQPPQHLSMLGLDGIDKKPEIFLTPNGMSTYVSNTATTPVPDLVAQMGSNHINGYELNTYARNGASALGYHQPHQQQQQQQASMYQHSHQASDTSMGASVLTTHDAYYGGNSGDCYQPENTRYGQSADGDGLYRAVMVTQTPCSVISNLHTTTANTPSPQQQQQQYPQSDSPTTLSAGTLYRQYLSHHELRSHPFAAPAYESPPQQQQQQAYVLGNPQAGDMYSDDEVFMASGVTSHHHIDPHMPMFQAPMQPIYGATTAATSNSNGAQCSPWPSGNSLMSGTLLPNQISNQQQQQHQLQHMLTSHLRYSPDEGYGEDGSSTTVGAASGIAPLLLPQMAHLEGTEV